MIRKLSFITIIVFVVCLTCPSFCSANGHKFKDISSQEFETDRLILRPQVEPDFEVLANYLLDEDVTKFLDITTEKGFKTQHEALQFLKSKSGFSNHVSFSIVLKSFNLPIGQIDAVFIDDDANFSYWLGKNFWGKGFASEACFLICSKVFGADDVRSISISCHFENKSSYKLACKIFDYLENNNKTSFKLIRSETPVSLACGSHEFVVNVLSLEKVSECN